MPSTPMDGCTTCASGSRTRTGSRPSSAGRARARGSLTAVVPDSAPEWLLLQRLGFRVRGTREYLCFKSFQRPAIMSWLFEHWSYSRGDTLRG